MPSGLVSLLSAAGIVALRIDASTVGKLAGEKTIVLPAPSQWAERETTMVSAGSTRLPVTWLALGAERAWATGSAAATVGAREPKRVVATLVKAARS
jgi:hypothetical protein